MEVPHYLTLFSAFDWEIQAYNRYLLSIFLIFPAFSHFFCFNYCTVQKKHLSLHRI